MQIEAQQRDWLESSFEKEIGEEARVRVDDDDTRPDVRVKAEDTEEAEDSDYKAEGVEEVQVPLR